MIDPFVVIAQLVNFAILVWLLKRFLYGPILRVMADREERVRTETEEARRLRAAATEEGEKYRALLAGFEVERETRLAAVSAEVDATRHERLRAARAEIQEMRERWHQTLDREKEDFLRELRLHVGQQSVELMRHAFRELADEDLDSRLTSRFLERLRTMEASERDRLVAAARADGDVFHLTTPLPASESLRGRLSATLADLVDGDVPELRFETNPELVAGVELRGGGMKVAWTVDDYLHTVEEALRDIFPAAASGGGGMDVAD